MPQFRRDACTRQYQRTQSDALDNTDAFVWLCVVPTADCKAGADESEGTEKKEEEPAEKARTTVSIRNVDS